MSKVSHLPKTVPSKKLPFSYSGKGHVSQHPYAGHFVVEVPDTRGMGRVGLEMARLCEGVKIELLDSNTRSLYNAIAFLKVNLSEAPAWFRNDSLNEQEDGMNYGLETMDYNVPIEIFKLADKLVDEWYTSMQGQPKTEE